MVMAMVTGYKKAKGTDIKPRFKMIFWGSFYTILVFVIFSYVYFIPENIFIKSKFEKIDYKALHKDFQFECSDCHNLIPPHLLPKESWIKLMNEQSDHYDEDLELEKNLVDSIEKYLVENSAENSTREASFKILNEIKDSKKFTISDTNYWKDTHKNIPKEVFKSDEVENKSNCVACHKYFEEGILSDSNIIYPPKK